MPRVRDKKHALAPVAVLPPEERTSLAGLSRDGLRNALAGVGVPEKQLRMRVIQLWRWMYISGVTSFDEMTDVSKDLRTALAARFTLDRPEIVAEQISIDGTRKWLLRLRKEERDLRAPEIECVYIPEEERGTLCISSQVGCTLNCSFCHTGTQRLVRNLTAGEIVGQVMVARDRLNDWADRENGSRLVTNIVMMGMGEPLYNFDNVRDACAIVADGEGLSISKRRITLSTSGVVPEIPRWGEEAGTMLAISLHAVRDELRDTLVPINRRWPIKDLLAACRAYPGLSNAKRITFEYVMLKGVNDSIADAKELVAHAKELAQRGENEKATLYARQAIQKLDMAGAFAERERVEANRQRELAQERLTRITEGLRMKQAVLSGDRDRIDAFLRARPPLPPSPGKDGGGGQQVQAMQKPSAIRFTARAEDLGYNNQSGQRVYKFSLMPDPAVLDQVKKTVAVITYRMDHPTFQNGLLATGVERNFTASYVGWGCLRQVVVLIEYIEPDRPSEIAEYDMCGKLGW